MALKLLEAEFSQGLKLDAFEKPAEPSSIMATSQAFRSTPIEPHDHISQIGPKTSSGLPIISKPSLNHPRIPVTSSKGFDIICSYNWVPPSPTSPPKLIIPGGAPVWHESITAPYQMAKETGDCLIDANDAYSPLSTFEPIFTALSVCNPDFNFKNVDLIVNRNSIRKLFDLARGKSTQAFQVKLHLVGKTVVMERNEVSAYGDDPDTRGYGHDFEELFTKQAEGLEGSISHHRVIRYDFGGLNCVVRYEVDGCMPPEEGEAEVVSTHPKVPESHQGLSVIPAVLKDGFPVSLPLVELKSTTSRKRKGPGSYLPQMWFGRVDWLKQGLHTDGNLDRITDFNAAEMFEEYETKYQDAFCNLESIIRGLIPALQRHPRGLTARWPGGVVGEGAGLVLSELDEPRKPLSDGIVRQFWGEKLPEFEGDERYEEPMEKGWYW